MFQRILSLDRSGWIQRILVFNLELLGFKNTCYLARSGWIQIILALYFVVLLCISGTLMMFIKNWT